jgi:hypothetical protein
MERTLNIAASPLELGSAGCALIFVCREILRAWLSDGMQHQSSNWLFSCQRYDGCGRGNNGVDVLEAGRRLTWARDTGHTLDGKEEVISARNLRFQ